MFIINDRQFIDDNKRKQLVLLATSETKQMNNCVIISI